ncbi:hypothetical protein LguiA_003236 [Lonicera macranthoides]
MEISMNFKLNAGKNFSLLHTKRSTKNSLTLKTITCTSSNNMTIQEEKKATNFYKVLSLSSEKVGFDEIKKAYRTMALKFHPDVSPNPSTKEENTRRFLELRDAYETLSDPVLRQRYDMKLYLGDDSLGFGFEGNRRGSFSREMLEMQLSGLKKRSNDRMERN